MGSGRGGGLRWRLLAAGVPAGVAGVAAWALVADDKAGWTVVAGAAAAVAGGFGPSVWQWLTARRQRRERRGRELADALVADLPASVAWLLHPQAAVVRFFGRGWVLRELQTWCEDSGASPVRLVVAGGGVGKTRLARHFATGLSGWTCWPVAPRGEARVARLVADGEAPARLLLVVDYAETRDPASLAALLCAAQRAEGVRVLLLARTAGLWWSTLSAAYPEQAHLVDALTTPANVVELSARVEERAPAEIVADAVAQFAAHLRYAPPVGFTPQAHDADTPVLRLHAEALLAVLGGPRGGGRYDVLAEVVGHEARYWRGYARRSGLVAADDADAREAVLRQVVGVAALLGADDDEQAAGIVRRAPLLGADPPTPVVDAFVRWLRGLYPAAGSGGALGTLQPDLLAEGLAVAVLRDCAPAERAAVFSGLPRAQAVRALTVLGRACAHQPDADEMIEAALGADLPMMTEAVLRVGTQFPGRFAARVANLLTTGPVPAGWAREWARRVPYPSLELGPVAVALTARVLGDLPPEAPPQERASWLSQQALRLAEVGRRAEALAASGEAVRLRRDLAAADRAAHLLGLARSVNNHAVRLAEAARPAEALATSAEAVGLYQELAAADRAAHLAELASSVHNHAVRLALAGRSAEALATSGEVVGLRRELATADRATHLADLAGSVNNHALRLAEAARPAEALATSAEAVDLYRELAAGNRDAHLPELAGAVSNHAIRLAQARWPAEALATSAEAVDLYRELAASNREAHLPQLAKALWVAGFVALIVGYASDHTVAMTAEGLRHLEALAAAEPAAFAELRDLAAETLARLRRLAAEQAAAADPGDAPPNRAADRG
ncbi:hypothetical protein [Micromonospora okii]|uniref:hypothetical protein n=1 Tax=Micromonospora okii TaxID=1182970 RepID=UPI001E34A776|nr:hypothetical protein [Micromonospora okii]